MTDFDLFDLNQIWYRGEIVVLPVAVDVTVGQSKCSEPTLRRDRLDERFGRRAYGYRKTRR